MSKNHYDILGLHPSCSVIEIRRSYRKLSKLYHPDTTELPPKIAIAKFQRLNEAYATLSHPHLRLMYDYEIGYTRVNVIESHQIFNEQTNFDKSQSTSIDPSVTQSRYFYDRPLSSGEIFALFMLIFTIVGCLLLVFITAYFRDNYSFLLFL